MNRELSMANTLAWMDYEFEKNPIGMIYIVCERCGHDRFEIIDSRRECGPSGLTVHTLLMSKCLKCGTIYEINISKMRVSE